jgi:hypothetical protein
MSKERKIDDKDLAEITGAGGVMDIPDAHVTDSTPVQDKRIPAAAAAPARVTPSLREPGAPETRHREWTEVHNRSSPDDPLQLRVCGCEGRKAQAFRPFVCNA